MAFKGTIKSRAIGFVYNLDRALASLMVGAPPQATISSMIGDDPTNPIDKHFAALLDRIQRDHIANAVAHANALQAVDNGDEK